MTAPVKQQPKRSGPHRVRFSVTLSKKTHERLTKLAEKENVTLSYALEYGISAWMKLPGRKNIK